MDTWDIYLMIFQIFSLMIGLGIAFFIYYILTHNNSSVKKEKLSNKRNVVEKPPIDMEAAKKSLKIIPIMGSFFASIPMMIIIFLIGIWIFENVFIAFILAVLAGQLIVYIFKNKIEHIFKK